MKLAVRLWVFGALVPALAMAAAFVLAGIVFERSLAGAMDEALLAQAAAEGVSLFDSPDRDVHLHLEGSPLLEQARPFAPVASVYGPSGEKLLVFPRGPEVPSRFLPLAEIGRPLLRDDGRWRELAVTLIHPKKGARYTLRLAASREEIARTLRRYYAATGTLTLLVAVALALFQARQARKLGRRVGALARHVAAVGHGWLDDPPPPDRIDDEIGSLRDGITRATAELRRARSARERLLAEAAHELRTPLAAMRTSLDLALRRERSAGELREALVETREEVDRLAGLASRLLDLAAMRAQPPARKTVDLFAVAQACVDAAAATASAKGVSLRLEGAPLLVEGDPEGLRRALDNVVDNALKFSPAGSVVAVRVEAAGAMARIGVEDEGPGIPAAEREQVFEPFHRADLTVAGTGLGLALVREQAERHGGRAFFAERERGARLVLELPRSDMDVRREPTTSSRANA